MGSESLFAAEALPSAGAEPAAQRIPPDFANDTSLNVSGDYL